MILCIAQAFLLLHMVLTGTLDPLDGPQWPQSHGWQVVLLLAGGSSVGLLARPRSPLRACLGFLSVVVGF